MPYHQVCPSPFSQLRYASSWHRCLRQCGLPFLAPQNAPAGTMISAAVLSAMLVAACAQYCPVAQGLKVLNPFVADLQLSPDLSKHDLVFASGAELPGMAEAQMSSLVVRGTCRRGEEGWHPSVFCPPDAQQRAGYLSNLPPPACAPAADAAALHRPPSAHPRALRARLHCLRWVNPGAPKPDGQHICIITPAAS